MKRVLSSFITPPLNSSSPSPFFYEEREVGLEEDQSFIPKKPNLPKESLYLYYRLAQEVSQIINLDWSNSTKASRGFIAFNKEKGILKIVYSNLKSQSLHPLYNLNITANFLGLEGSVQYGVLEEYSYSREKMLQEVHQIESSNKIHRLTVIGHKKAGALATLAVVDLLQKFKRIPITLVTNPFEILFDKKARLSFEHLLHLNAGRFHKFSLPIGKGKP